MENVIINNKPYMFSCEVKDNEKIRTSFNNLTRKTYGFNFEQWYREGYWTEKYIPHVLIDGDKVVSNISINLIDVLMLGEKKKFIQIGTVMTDNEYKKQGLNKFIMKNILNKWKDKCDLIYLFANDTVLNYYPKFGFNKVDEYQHIKYLCAENSCHCTRKLDMSDINDKELLEKYLRISIPISKVSMINNQSLIMFYCISFMKENIYYIEQLDCIVIAEQSDDTLVLYDIFSPNNITINNIVFSIANRNIKKVILGFTPINESSNYRIKRIQEKDNTLFVLDNQVKAFEENKLMFPILSHA